VVSQTIPIRATPTPAWANTVPQVERGSPRAPPHRGCKGHAEQAAALGKVAQRPHDDEHRQSDSKWRKGAAAARPRPQHRECDQRRDTGGDPGVAPRRADRRASTPATARTAPRSSTAEQRGEGQI